MRLTDQRVKSLETPPKGFKIYLDEEPRGFGVRVTAAGVKAFVLTYGKERERITIGRYPTISLSDARTEAKRFLAERTLGKLRPARLRASEALERFLVEQREKNRPITVRYTEALIRNHFPKLLGKNLEDVRTDDVTDVTDKLLKKGQSGAANHAFTAIRTFLKWCVKRRYIPHSPVESLDPPSKNSSRARVLSDAELRTVWRAADETGYPFGAIVKLLILTGQRRGEIANLRADWLSENSCTIPKEITKNKRAHTFPIGQMTQNLLAKIHSGTSSSALMFAARGQGDAKPFNGWSKSKAALDAKAKIEPWVLHDIRRSYATTLQRLGVRTEVIEALLNHVSGTKAGIVGVYQKHRWEAEMREAVNLYDDWFRATIMTKDDELTRIPALS